MQGSLFRIDVTDIESGMDWGTKGVGRKKEAIDIKIRCIVIEF